MYFLRDSFSLSVISLSRQRHAILGIFVCCSWSRVLHVILTDPQTFGFEFHLRLLPCAFSRQLVPKLVALLFAVTPCWRDQTRSNQLFTVVILGFRLGLYHVVVALSCLYGSQHDEVTNKYGNQHAWLPIVGKGSEHCEQAKVFLYVEDIVNLLPTLGLEQT